MNSTRPGEAAPPRSDFQTFTLMGAHLVNALHGTGEFCRTADYRALEAQHKAALEEIMRLENIITGPFSVTAALHETLDKAGCVSVTKPELATLRTKLAEAEKDAERLDILERLFVGNKWADSGAMQDMRPEDSKYIGDTMSFRQAIDAYRSTHPMNQP